MKKDHAKKRYIGKIIVAFLFGAAIMAFIRYISYGSMNSGTQVNNEEFLKVAEEIDDIAIPKNVKIFALGEATHGNKEFQELKLDMFRKMGMSMRFRMRAMKSRCACNSKRRVAHRKIKNLRGYETGV